MGLDEWQKSWVILVKNSSGRWETAGPYTDEELKEKLVCGEINLQTWVWQKGLSKWTALGSLSVASNGVQWRYEPKLRPALPNIEELGWSDRLDDLEDTVPDDAIGEDLLKSKS